MAKPGSPHFKNIEKGELGISEHKIMSVAAKECGIDFISTPFSVDAVDLLEDINVPAYKVASMDCVNRHILSAIALTKKPIYLSTGMATLDEIDLSLEFLKKQESGDVTLMHCMSLYPAQAQDLNLSIISFFRKTYSVKIGYSDHYPGIDACLAAYALGAEVIETHFTLDASTEGGDHNHSATPEMLKVLVARIRLFNEMKGSCEVLSCRPDREFASSYRRGVYASRKLSSGKCLEIDDLLMCRPESSLSPNDIEGYVGKVLNEDVDKFEEIKAAVTSSLK